VFVAAKDIGFPQIHGRAGGENAAIKELALNIVPMIWKTASRSNRRKSRLRKASSAGRFTIFKSAVKDLAAIQHGVVKAITGDRREQCW